jgi:sister-chromatid-cohesion protein PDS5
MPEIFSSNVKELCKSLQDNCPSETKFNDPGSVETLRACAEFAKNRPENIPHDRKFIQTLINFSLYGTPPKASKYAVGILMAAASERKEMHIKDLLEKTTSDWTYGENHFLSKLATISQLSLMDSKLADDVSDAILDITTQQILLQVRTPASSTDPSWQSEAELDEECQAKLWAIKILVNRLRGIEDPETAKENSVPVFKLLNALIYKEGEMSKQKDTPSSHRSHLRLVAGTSTNISTFPKAQLTPLFSILPASCKIHTQSMMFVGLLLMHGHSSIYVEDLHQQTSRQFPHSHRFQSARTCRTG